MFDPIEPLIGAVVDRVVDAWDRRYGEREPACRRLLAEQSRQALTEISRSDALYHDANHTAVVTLVGQEILRGKQESGEPVAATEWLHFVLSLLFHDIGFVGGVCRGDRDGVRMTGLGDCTVEVPAAATDAFLAPYHVDRGKLCVRERFAGDRLVDPEVLAATIERTRFPVPDKVDYRSTSDLPGLVRAADLLGQLADPGRDRRVPALFHEFEEIGLNARLGYSSPADLRADSARFFERAVAPQVGEAMGYLQATEEGRYWVDSLRRHPPIARMVEELLARVGAG